MNCEMTQIKLAYEQEKMTPEQIAADRELDIAAVKAALMQCSSQYRKACGKEDLETDDLNFSDSQLRQVNEVIMELALTSEDEHLRFKAATYIRDDKKGRKDVVAKMGQVGPSINILSFNTQLMRARELTEKMKQALSPGQSLITEKC